MRRLRWARSAAWALLAVCVIGALPGAAVATESVVPRPPELERDVQFWIRVYTEVTTNEGFLHDEHNLGVIYQAVHFAPNSTSNQRRQQLDGLRDGILASLRRLAAGSADPSEEDQRIRAMFGSEASPARFTQALGEVRFQLGQSDRFRAGIVRSGAWEAHIADTLANLGLPPEIAALPHVESSFDPTAYSKVGASGLWQFMRSTGRRFLRIDDAVDERMDPFRATEAAAQLLDFNYRLLGTWPLALTAYNHGAAGMRRARDSMGTNDIARIVRQHKSPLFGFASRNFYVSFLAALEIDRNPEKYFGPIERRPEMRFREVTLPSYVPVTSLERVLKVDRTRLEDLNPALRPAVWKGQRLVPQGYKLRLPVDAGDWTTERLAARLDTREQYASQPRPRSYKVRGGDTLASIARQQSVAVEDLAALNNMKVSAKLKAGRSVLLPETGPALASATPPAVAAAAATKSAERFYVVRSGDALIDIAARVGVPVSTLVALNQIRNPDSVYEGQRLRLSSEVAPTPDTLVAAVAASPPAAAKVATQALLSEKQAETREAANVGRPTPQAEVVSTAQAEAQSPALIPGGSVPQASDPVEYGVAADGSIRVAAAETLGHYADWLGLTASRLRELNAMRPGRPVIIGRPLKLEFGKVTREQFETKRRDYHQQLQAVFFTSHRIIGTEVYVARRGDSLWAVTQRYASLPVWLLQQYNPDLDFADLRSGTQIVVPKVEEVPTV
ncbi:MAG TPA: LysM peptidoglycan-binding domain-containing protein [Steroidobacteraceae bacterium]|nr:LysM peptidoglycan-binding domain-containing protein [Steroidobacteraceae bacterium]